MIRDCKRTDNGYRLTAPVVELMVLQQAVWEIVDLLHRDDESYEEATDDPFAAWAEQMEVDEPDEDVEETVEERRLFPNPYPDDPRAAAEWRRYTRNDQRRQKVREAHAVIDLIDVALEETMLAHGWSRMDELDGSVEMSVVIPRAGLDAWLRTTNASRLVLAARLDVTTSEDADRVEQMMFSPHGREALEAAVYELVGVFQALLLEAEWGDTLD